MSLFVAHDIMNAMEVPIAVEYCQICGLPADYCKYGPLWDIHPKEMKEINEAETKESVSAPNVDVESRTSKSGLSRSSANIVTVKIAPRIGRRYLSVVSGLHACDVDLGKAVKIFSKKFACGVGRKDESDEVEIQGDVEEHIVDTITTNFKTIKAKQIVIKRK